MNSKLNKTSRLPYEMPKIQIGCFIDQFLYLRSWMELRIQYLPFFSHNTTALTFIFTKENKTFKRKNTFVSSEIKIVFFLGFLGEKKNIFFHFYFQREEKTHILFLKFFRERQFSHVEKFFYFLFILIVAVFG